MKVVIRFTEFYEEAPGAIRMFVTPETGNWEGWVLRFKPISEEADAVDAWGLMLQITPPGIVHTAPMILLQAPAKSRDEWDRWLLENVEYIDFDGVRFYERSLAPRIAGRVRDWQRVDN